LVEELRQEFFGAYPELVKTPQANPMFSNDKRYLNEVCAKYNASNEDKALWETRAKIAGTTETMKNNMVLMMASRDDANVMDYIISRNLINRLMILLTMQGNSVKVHSFWKESLGGDREDFG